MMQSNVDQLLDVTSIGGGRCAWHAILLGLLLNLDKTRKQGLSVEASSVIELRELLFSR